MDTHTKGKRMSVAEPTWKRDLYALLARIASTYETATPAEKAELEQRMRPILRRLKYAAGQRNPNQQDRRVILNNMVEARSTLDSIMGANWSPQFGGLGQKLTHIGLL